MNGLQRALHSAIDRYVGHFPDHRGKWRIVRAAAAFSGLERADRRSVVAFRAGCRFRLDLSSHIDRKIFYQGGHERWDTEALLAIVQPGWTVVDVGANIGWYSAMAARRCGPEGRVFAFEISAPESGRFEETMRLSGFSRVELVRSALSDREGPVGITATRDAGMTAIALSEEDRAATVPATTLDRFRRERGCGPVRFIKCDIEGGEAAFLRGAEETLREDRPALLMEINPGALARFGSSGVALIAALRGFGYRLYSAGRAGLAVLPEKPDIPDFINALGFPEALGTGPDIPWESLRALFAGGAGGSR